MMRFAETQGAGKRAEDEVSKVLERFTSYVYRNVVVDTLHTKSGHTEIDIIAAIGDSILVIEVKNISAIQGKESEMFWTLTGLETAEKYSTLNILVQNRIHVRALKDVWYKERQQFPKIQSFVVVPNTCSIPSDIEEAGVYSVSQFSKVLAQLSNTQKINPPKYAYSLEFLVSKNKGHIIRDDLGG